MKTSPSKNKKYTLEFPIKSSPPILFEFLSTPSGLAQWFADNVDVRQNVFTFNWDGNLQKAKVMEHQENDRIKFRWEDGHKDEYFEFKILTTEITGDTVLLITDFGNPREMKDAQRLWESQVHELKQRLGGL
jgi:uncharacterized protein YndB with AHSA1/START domain